MAFRFCGKAVLIYPSEESAGFSVPFTKFRVRSMAFSLGEDLDEAGERLMADLLDWVEETPNPDLESL